jgi:hypothetical protein
MAKFEEMKFKNDFIKIFDDDGLITIQMKIDNVIEIINYFDVFIKKYQNEKHDFNLDGDILKLELKFDDSYIMLQGTIDGSFYHNFDIEECSVKDWNKIVKFVKNPNKKIKKFDEL